MTIWADLGLPLVRDDPHSGPTNLSHIQDVTITDLQLALHVLSLPVAVRVLGLVTETLAISVYALQI